VKAQSELPALQLAYSAAKEDDRLEEALKLRKEIDALKKAAAPHAEVIAGWRRGVLSPTPSSLLATVRDSGASTAVLDRFQADHSAIFASDFTKSAKADPTRALTAMRAAIAAQESLMSQSEDPLRVLGICKTQLVAGLEFVKKVRARSAEETAVSKLVFSSAKVIGFVNGMSVHCLREIFYT
jgi:hypothetical protein